MDKKAILNAFANQVQADIAAITKAALAAREAAIHTESKAEDQYDTRGLEASYLAGAQSKRAMELEELLNIFRTVELHDFSKSGTIVSTALVELNNEGKASFCLLMPKGGGMTTTIEGKLIQVITPQSPLGEALLGQKVGSEISVTIQGRERDYEIVSVL